MRIISLLCGIVAIVVAGPVFSQESSVRSQLDSLARTLAAQGWSQAENDIIGTLRDDATSEWPVFLVKNVSYQLRGVCDNDCSDLDLALFDEYDNLVSRDYGTDDTPVVRTTPTSTGRFKLRVVMADCQIAPCNYGVRTFANR